MNTFKTIGVAIMLSLSLLLSGVACVLIAVSMKQHQPAATPTWSSPALGTAATTSVPLPTGGSSKR